MITLRKDKFFRVQAAFYRTVINLPVLVTFRQQVLDPAATPFEKLNRSAELVIVDKKVRCLYQRQFSAYDRQRYGLNEDCTGALFIPPKELIDVFGTFQLASNTLLIKMSDLKDDEQYLIDKVVYLEPLYNSCISVMYHLLSNKKQGA